MSNAEFNPDEFVKRYSELLHEVEQLRKHRVELLGKYESMRDRMQHIKVHAMALEGQRRSGSKIQQEEALQELQKTILIKGRHQ